MGGTPFTRFTFRFHVTFPVSNFPVHAPTAAHEQPLLTRRSKAIRRLFVPLRPPTTNLSGVICPDADPTGNRKGTFGVTVGESNLTIIDVFVYQQLSCVCVPSLDENGSKLGGSGLKCMRVVVALHFMLFHHRESEGFFVCLQVHQTSPTRQWSLPRTVRHLRQHRTSSRPELRASSRRW